MSVAQTRAALKLEKQGSKVSSHKVISLLMEGALERISQAKEAIKQGNEEDSIVLIQKIIAIVNGLRNSLNLEVGGEIAVNLDNLYDYIVQRIQETNKDDRSDAMDEIGKLIEEIKSGWDEIEPKNRVAQAS